MHDQQEEQTFNTTKHVILSFDQVQLNSILHAIQPPPLSAADLAALEAVRVSTKAIVAKVKAISVEPPIQGATK